MALTIKDILQLHSLKKMELISGYQGLLHYVSSAGIADYEFCSDLDYPRENAFEKGSFVLSSLLFAKENPASILPAVKQLFEAGVSALAYKTVIFQDLPEEVIVFSNENDFPIFRFGTNVYFENIIFEITDAIRLDDTNLLTETNIKKMIHNEFSKSQVYFLSKNISLSFKEYSMGVYIKSSDDGFRLNLDRYYKNFYLNRNLNDKALLCKYEDGLFAILTSHQNNVKSFQIILSDLLNFLALNANELFINCSNIHRSYECLDLCFRESFHTHIASLAENRNLSSYSAIGIYQYLIPLQNEQSMQSYMDSLITPLLGRPEYFDTVMQLVLHGGDALQAAGRFDCHQNTIRYRMNKIKALLGLESETEQDFYAILASAMRLYLLKKSK